MQIIKDTPRKLIRYLMFNKKRGAKPDNPVVSRNKDREILNFFESQENFTSWDDFETLWDIGMGDDAVAQSNRLEKWFLFDKSKEDIVFRPNDYWEKEAIRQNTSTHALFTKEAQQRGIPLAEFFTLFFT